jgi:hypothetical protein
LFWLEKKQKNTKLRSFTSTFFELHLRLSRTGRTQPGQVPQKMSQSTSPLLTRFNLHGYFRMGPTLDKPTTNDIVNANKEIEVNEFLYHGMAFLDQTNGIFG